MLKEYRTLVPYVRERIGAYIAGFFCLVLTDGGQLLIPQILKSAINRISSGQFVLREIFLLMGGMVLLAAAIALGRYGWRYFLHGSSRRIETELRGRLFSHLMTLSPSFFGRNRTGDLMARATNDMQAIRMAVGMALVAFTDGVFMTLSILIILFVQYPTIALYTVLPLPILTVMVILLGKVIGDRFRRVQEGFSRISEQVQEALSGIRVIKSFVQEDSTLEKFRQANREYRNRNMDLVKIWGFFFPIVTFLAGLTTLILLFLGGQRVITGQIQAGDFVAILSYLEMLIWPMLGAGFMVNMLQRGAASLARINEVLREEPEIRSPAGGSARVPDGSIRVERLSFSYPGSDEPVLQDISFEVPDGTILGILGRTGSGKSTLLRLLPRILDPSRGSVFVGGLDIHEYELHALRSAFGMVPQDTFLFSASIRENVAFGAHDAPESLLREVMDVSTISRDLETFPKGWETEVGERGITLSGGQKQRVAISRALAPQPAVLVFDDALSAVDTETEELILRRLLAFRRRKTGIIVSHRVSTLKVADNIIVLDGGRKIQEGSHEALLDEEGLYREIYELQRLQEEQAGRNRRQT